MLKIQTAFRRYKDLKWCTRYLAARKIQTETRKSIAPAYRAHQSLKVKKLHLAIAVLKNWRAFNVSARFLLSSRAAASTVS